MQFHAGGRVSPIALACHSLRLMAVDIKPVRTRLARHRFVDFPFKLFKHDPTWVPPLRMSVLDRISPKYPANDHQHTALCVAYRERKCGGRLGGWEDPKCDGFHARSGERMS